MMRHKLTTQQSFCKVQKFAKFFIVKWNVQCLNSYSHPVLWNLILSKWFIIFKVVENIPQKAIKVNDQYFQSYENALFLDSLTCLNFLSFSVLKACFTE